MSEEIYPVKPGYAQNAIIDEPGYQKMYRRSIEDSDAFWAEQADSLQWSKRWDRVQDCDYSKASIKWFEGGKLNACVNCVDRHLPQHADKVAIYWQGEDDGNKRSISYQQLHEGVCRMANVMRQRGVKRGDRVSIYMPMVPEAMMAMLACARIGAVHSVVFGGFSSQSLRDRILDSGCVLVVTADTGARGGKVIAFKERADEAVAECPDVHTVLVMRLSGDQVKWDDGRDVWLDDAMAAASTDCPAEDMDAEDPLFILYTSGSTGQPKGVLHTTGGYLLYASLTHRYVFDYHDDDIYWCTADIGWITGHSYMVYGPMCNAATSFVYEGVPTYPHPGRFWELVERYKISLFYTAPTALRALMREGNEPVQKFDRSSLRVLGTVGEPINVDAWRWYHDVVGNGGCPIVDTWWQTETGGIMITPLPGATRLKPGSATKPFFGIVPALLDVDGKPVHGVGSGNLVITRSWPGQMRTVFGDHERFFNTYFSAYPGYYFSGDGARRDKDGYYWITGRVDDVINVSGHRIGTAEVESALGQHAAVAESAVVGYPHDVKGQGIYAYVTLKSGQSPSDELKKELVKVVRKVIGPVASPDVIQWAPSLPKTRSGKIMRRILRKVAANECEQLGDISTLAEPAVVDDIITNRVNK
ncbi:MAG: acetate--CoA ligase [Candidatus Porifericomitaceae bacterium WSBS_2022_MAG_OTU9]